ncbi:MAG: cupin domain-containing protein [Alkalispirochaeta sp.]
MKQPIKKQFFKKDAKESGAYRWADLPVKDYPAAGTRSQGMTKQVLFDADEHLLSELRYFEAEPGGYSALERHDHIHAVLILRGHGKVLMGDHIEDVARYDTLYIPPQTWHQFYAAQDTHLGFLCLVNGERDRPARPTEADIADLQKNTAIADFIRW